MAPENNPTRQRGLPSRVLQVTAELVINLALLALLYAVWQLTWNDHRLATEQARLTQSVERNWSTAAASASSTAPAKAWRTGDPIAVLHVPRFGHDWSPRTIVEGVGADELARGAGHYPGTTAPGLIGNFAVAGHRQTHGSAFAQIAELRPGDPIVVETGTHWYVYRVIETAIVPPTAVDVIDPAPDRPGTAPVRPLLTLTSCHPMYSSRERYVVHAALVQTTTRAAGRPVALGKA